MIYIWILLAVIGSALAFTIVVRLLGSQSSPQTSDKGYGLGNLKLNVGAYASQLKTLATLLLTILLLSIFFPQSAHLFFTDMKLLGMFVVGIMILFLNFNKGESQFFTGLFKWFVIGVIAYIIFTVLVQPYVDFDTLGEKINAETDRVGQSIGQDADLGEDFSQKNLPPLLRVGPHTKTSPVKISPDGRLEFVKVAIDGTNEFENYPVGQRKGHDTTLVLEPGECVEVERQAGWLSYLYQTGSGEWKIGHPQIYGGDSWRVLGGGDTAFYPYEDTRNSVLLILWSGNEYEVFRIPQAHNKVAGCNAFDGSADVFLFFNTPELLRNRVTGIQEDMFRLNGWDGSEAIFDIKLCEETTEEATNAWYFDCKR